jgi:hypothetical protein
MNGKLVLPIGHPSIGLENLCDSEKKRQLKIKKLQERKSNRGIA